MTIVAELLERFGAGATFEQATCDGIPTVWSPVDRLLELLRYLKNESPQPYKMLYDLTALDERARDEKPAHDYTAVYQLLSFVRNEYVRVKVALNGEAPALPSATAIWPAANWYEREVWDMFGIRFSDHPHLTRILMPPTWKGHPLRKDHPARATELPPEAMESERVLREEDALRFRPSDWGLPSPEIETRTMYLNIGPQHPGTHGVFRIVLRLNGEEIMDLIPDIGYHHRGAEKMGERQTWHKYIPYTDRVDYLGGVMNNLPYVMAVERLASIEVPERAQTIRVMLAELFRIASHLVWYGTFAQDVGALSPVFYMFTDRERLFEIIEAICGGRLHPSWFRIGGVAADLPRGWDVKVREFLDYLPGRLAEYDRLVLRNRIFQARTKGIGAYTTAEAIEWGVTGPGLRATGFAWDHRRAMPYSIYEQLQFDIPTATAGDCYARAIVRVEELRQSLRIIRQCVDHMPAGPVLAAHPLATPARRGETMRDIETLITHFLNVSWGPPMPPGESFASVEATKGNNGYFVVSDGNAQSYRTRIRTPSFPHLQMLPLITRGFMVSDLAAILGALDFVLSDVDR